MIAHIFVAFSEKLNFTEIRASQKIINCKAVESILENKTAFEPIRESVTVSSLYAACLGQI